MAFNAATQWEFQTTGDNTNGGGFFNATPGTSVDLALANTPVTFTDLVIDATTNTKITSALRPFTMADAGNIINITSGTGFTVQRVQIVSVDGSNVATCDKAVGTVASIDGNGKMGGALAVPTDALFDLVVRDNTVHIKYGTYTLTDTIYPTSSGIFANPIRCIGYKTTRLDMPVGNDRPTIACGAYSFYGNNGWVLDSLIFAGTAEDMFAPQGYLIVRNIKATNSSSTANRYAIKLAAASCKLFCCEGISTNGYGIGGTAEQIGIIQCYCHDSAWGLYHTGSYSNIVNCISESNTTGALYLGAAASSYVIGNTLFGSDGKTGTGILMSSGGYASIMLGNIITGFTTGINRSSGSVSALLLLIDQSNFYNNTTDVSNVVKGSNCIALDPAFADAANGDFTPGDNMKLDIDWTKMGL